MHATWKDRTDSAALIRTGYTQLATSGTMGIFEMGLRIRDEVFGHWLKQEDSRPDTVSGR